VLHLQRTFHFKRVCVSGDYAAKKEHADDV